MAENETDDTRGTAHKGPTGALGDLVKAESMIQLAVALPIGCLIGWGFGTLADKHFHTAFWAIVGIVLGAVGGFIPDLYDGATVSEAVSALTQYKDEDFRLTILRALRLLAVVTAVALPLVWWKAGWRSAALLAVGAVISASGLWEWLRLMSAVMTKMDGGETARPMGLILLGFFLRLGLTVVVLYVSLKFLDGSVYALAAGLALGVFALTVEGLRLVKAWTV